MDCKSMPDCVRGLHTTLVLNQKNISRYAGFSCVMKMLLLILRMDCTRMPDVAKGLHTEMMLVALSKCCF